MHFTRAKILALLLVLSVGLMVAGLQPRGGQSGVDAMQTLSKCELASQYAETLIAIGTQLSPSELTAETSTLPGWSRGSLVTLTNLLQVLSKCGREDAGDAIDQPVNSIIASGLGVLSSAVVQLNSEIESQTEQIAQLESEREAYLSRTPALVYPLVSTTASSSDATAMVYMDPDPNGWGGIIAFRGMTPPPSGQVYQLWMITNGQVTPGPTFMPDQEGKAMVQVGGDAAGAGQMAITMEPDGGSQTPTTSPVMQGDLTA